MKSILAFDGLGSVFMPRGYKVLRVNEVSTGSETDRVGTHASGVLRKRSMSTTARQRRAYPVGNYYDAIA